jgi:thymidylate synthase (FAD)
LSIEVTFLDHMGSDLRVVDAARVSFGKRSQWESWENRTHADPDHPLYTAWDSYTVDHAERHLSFNDYKLVNYLARHKHKSPFNHTFATFHVKAPIFVARQLVKHEYMPWNELSRRYVEDGLEWYFPETWRAKAEDKKQGSGDEFDEVDSADFNRFLRGICNTAKEDFAFLLNQGVAPEMARMVLPSNLMTEWYWSGTMYAFAKMCALRLDATAQYEARLVAQPISDKMSELFPVSWEALKGNVL